MIKAVFEKYDGEDDRFLFETFPGPVTRLYCNHAELINMIKHFNTSHPLYQADTDLEELTLGLNQGTYLKLTLAQLSNMYYDAVDAFVKNHARGVYSAEVVFLMLTHFEQKLVDMGCIHFIGCSSYFFANRPTIIQMFMVLDQVRAMWREKGRLDLIKA